MKNCFHTKPVSAIDQRRSPLRFPNKVTQKMRFGIVQTLDRSLRDDRAVVGPHDVAGLSLGDRPRPVAMIVRHSLPSTGHPASFV